jgi:hypothetical protein
MRHFVVNAVTCETQEARLGLGVSTVKSVFVTVFAAAGLIVTVMPHASAGNRPAPKQYSPVSSNASTAAPSNQDAGKYERKCVIMSCGTPWCFNTRR